MTSCAVISAFIAQPTTRWENRSITGVTDSTQIGRSFRGSDHQVGAKGFGGPGATANWFATVIVAELRSFGRVDSIKVDKTIVAASHRDQQSRPIRALVIGECGANVFANRPTVRSSYSANDVAKVSVLSTFYRFVVAFAMYVMNELVRVAC